MLEILPLNNIYCSVDCEPSIGQELSDFFTFTVPGSEFSPAFKARHWDGKIRLFNVRTNQIYTGLARHVAEFAKMHGYHCIDKTITPDGNITDEEIVATLKDLKLPINPRDYQLKAFVLAMRKKRSVIVSPTASGKSLIIYLCVRQLLKDRQRGLLIVPTVSLVEQMYSDFASYGWDVEKNCQRIYAGKSRLASMPMVISTWQSLFEMPKEYFEQFDFIIGDEAHQFKAKSLKHIMESLVNCDVRIGTTGTLDGTQVHKLVLEGLFGPVKNIISTRELIDKGHLAELNIQCLVLKYPESVRKLAKGLDYNSEIEFLIGNAARNKFITDHVKSLHGNTLVLYTRVGQHGQILYDMLKDEDRKVFFVYAKTPALEREEIRRLTELENDAIIVASYGTFSTGINIRNLHNLMLASPTKSKIRTMQSLGRSLRVSETKTKANLIDIADDLRTGSFVNITLKHLEARTEYYSAEKLPFKIMSVDV